MTSLCFAAHISSGNPVDAAFLVSDVLIAVAALHPSMAEALVRATEGQTAGRYWMPLVAIAGFVSPVILLIGSIAGMAVDVPVLAGTSIALFALIVVRFSWLFSRTRRQTLLVAERGESLQNALDTQLALQEDLTYQAFHDGLTGLMLDPVHTAQVLTDLKVMGIRIAIDDFGTGYSSLSYLQLFPVDMLKIDKPFVDPLIDPRSEGAAFVKTILRMARDLHLTTNRGRSRTPDPATDPGRAAVRQRPGLPHLAPAEYRRGARVHRRKAGRRAADASTARLTRVRPDASAPRVRFAPARAHLSAESSPRPVLGSLWGVKASVTV